MGLCLILISYLDLTVIKNYEGDERGLPGAQLRGMIRDASAYPCRGERQERFMGSI
jgi:hypothetical protein